MQTIKIDFDNPGFPQRLDVVENDAQSRFFKAVLYKDGKAYAAPSGATYSIMYQGFGPQNKGWYDTINDGAGKRAACSVSGNVVTCEIARQALRVPGHVSVVLCVTGSNGYMLHGWPIDCNCRNDNYTGGTSVESFFYITQVTNAAWTSAIQTWEELKNMIDPTLSVPGKAADAAKVGDKGFLFRAVAYTGDLDTTVSEGNYGLRPSIYNGTKGLNLSNYAFMTVYRGTTLSRPPSDLDVTQIIVTFSERNDYRFYIRSFFAGVKPDFVEMPFNTRKQRVCFIGDSFTDEFSDTPSRHSYTYYLNKLTTKYDITNYGVSGATAYSWYTKNYNKITDQFDTFFIALGLNFNANEPGDNDGDINDTIDSHTFYGSMNAIIGKILEVNPRARVIIWCMDAWYAEHRSIACKNLANKWGCEYYSMKADTNIPVRNNGKYGGVMPGLSTDVVTAKNKAYFYKYPSDSHPNNAGQLMLATYLCNII